MNYVCVCVCLSYLVVSSFRNHRAETETPHAEPAHPAAARAQQKHTKGKDNTTQTQTVSRALRRSKAFLFWQKSVQLLIVGLFDNGIWLFCSHTTFVLFIYYIYSL